MADTPFVETDAGRIIAQTIWLCNHKPAWILETHPEKLNFIWHRLLPNSYRTVCGGQVTYPYGTTTTGHATAPLEEEQCIVCQFELSHLNLVEGFGPPPKPNKPKAPPSPPTGPDYTPTPPAIRLQVPKAIAA